MECKVGKTLNLNVPTACGRVDDPQTIRGFVDDQQSPDAPLPFRFHCLVLSKHVLLPISYALCSMRLAAISTSNFPLDNAIVDIVLLKLCIRFQQYNIYNGIITVARSASQQNDPANELHSRMISWNCSN